jgi:hypothetical protein
MQPGTPSPQQPLAGVQPDHALYTNQWRPGRLAIAFVVMAAVVVGAWMLTQ